MFCCEDREVICCDHRNGFVGETEKGVCDENCNIFGENLSVLYENWSALDKVFPAFG